MKNDHPKFEQVGTYNSSCLSADGCFQRHQRPRKHQEMTFEETRMADFAGYGRGEWAERRLLDRIARLQALGCELKADESMEQYVQRHAELWNEEGNR